MSALATVKSKTCVGKVSKKPLTEYRSEADAERGAAWARDAYGRDLSPYRCSRCNRWHLAPTSRRTPSYDCGYCTGADGRYKATYGSSEDAERRADILRDERGVDLRVYPCPHDDGWHLTKQGW